MAPTSYHTFFGGCASVAGTLIGLLFVAISVAPHKHLGTNAPLAFQIQAGDVAGRRASVREVLSYGAPDAGKTEGATGPSRRPPIDALLADDLVAWKAAPQAPGYPTGDDDFLVRGDLGGHGAPTAT